MEFYGCWDMASLGTSYMDETEFVRLQDGDGYCSGRVEVKTNQSWASVCKDGFDKEDEKVVCSELGCGAPSYFRGSFGRAEGPILSKQFQCRGNESRLQDCATSSSTSNSCKPQETAGVACREPYELRLVGGGSRCEGRLEGRFQGEWRPLFDTWHYFGLDQAAKVCRELDCESVRIVNGNSRCSGQVEVKSDQSWVPVCEADFDWQDAAVVCAELGCGFQRAFSRVSNHGTMWSKEFECEGREKRLLDCPTSGSAKDTCSTDNAHLTCIELPESPTVTLYSSQGEVAHGVIFKGHRFLISCTASGMHHTILSFRLKSYGQNCTEQTQPAVHRSAYFLFPAAENAHRGTYEYRNDVRLEGRGSRCAGRLEVEHQQEFRPVSYWDSWGLKDAAVVCRQLNCGSAVSTAKNASFANPLPTWRFFSDCDGSESALMDCGAVKLWPSSSTVEVVCSDLLLQPNLTVYSFMAGPSEGQPQDLQLFRGQSFNISCSIQPQYPGGQFTLMLNQTLTQTQQAVNHSAHFLFPAADDAHQGNYSCIYHNYVFNRNFSSESQTLSLTVTEPEDVELMDGGSRCAGSLAVLNQEEWMLVGSASTAWSLKHAAIVCRQLGCGSAVSTKTTDVLAKKPAWRFFSDCDGSESMLMDCGTVRLWPSSSVIEVVCSGHRGADAQERKQ
ncbi:scavenger receptor cysteine-rich type 1 protein M130-like [Centroberyx affinis]|uniref:scavenger receptor cysteine-rich type 1 protein M130-like n=1 Tax=Centroberyx affinis TaxID=166261 RepID=UPI003A5C5C88